MLVEEIGPNASAVSVEEAAAFGEMVLVAITFGRCETLGNLAAQLPDKLVIDATSYYPQRDGQLDFGGLTSSEVISQHLPDTRLVKAFNTM